MDQRPPPPILRVGYGDQELDFMVQPWFRSTQRDEPGGSGEYDIVVAGLSGTAGADLAAVARAAERMLDGPTPLRAGGCLVLVARLEEGGDHEAVGTMLEPLLRERSIVVAASEAPELVRLAGLRAAVDVEEGLDIAYERVGRPPDASVLVLRSAWPNEDPA